jgi:hypothetical protein
MGYCDYSGENSFSNNQEKIWDPYVILEFCNPDRGAFTCVGYAPSQGRRCRNPIAAHNRAAVQDMLDRMASKSPKSSVVADLLAKIAPLSLCVRYHQDQAQKMVRQWESKIRSVKPFKRESSWNLDEELDFNDNRGSFGTSAGWKDSKSFSRASVSDRKTREQKELEHENEELKQEMEDLEEQKYKLESEKCKLQKERDELKREKRLLEMERDMLKTEKTLMEWELETLKRERDELKRKAQEKLDKKTQEQEREKSEQEDRGQETQEKEREERERQRKEREKHERDEQNERIRQAAQRKREERERQAREKAEKEKREWEEAWKSYIERWIAFRGMSPNLTPNPPPTTNSASPQTTNPVSPIPAKPSPGP